MLLLLQGVRTRLFSKSQRWFMAARSLEMDSCKDYVVPPEAVRGCTTINKAAFDREFEFHCVKICNPKLCKTFVDRLSHARIQCSYVKGVVPVATTDDSKSKELLIILGPSYMVQKLLTDEDHSWIAANEGVETTHVLKLGYDDFSRTDILRAILPMEMAVTSSLEEAGHIAHYNLKPEYFPYKRIIGQVTLDKHKNIRTVVNKVEELGAASSFRFFKMELLAGENDYITSLQENRCTFTMDYSKVYWNSRLKEEHGKLVGLFKKNEVVLDVFAGVGPFSIPAARIRRCFVHANDLNPHSYTYLLQNVKNNNVSNQVMTYNLDGTEFIASVSKRLVQQSLPLIHDNQNVSPFSHVIMNLPGSATKFLKAFRGVFNQIPAELRRQVLLPQIHCYCFADSEENFKKSKMDPIENVTSHLGVEKLEEGQYTVHKVRSVSTMTVMMRVSFRLPHDVAYMSCEDNASKTVVQTDEEGTQDSKKNSSPHEEPVEGSAAEESVAAIAEDCCVVNKPAPRVEEVWKEIDLEEPEPKRCKTEGI